MDVSKIGTERIHNDQNKQVDQSQQSKNAQKNTEAQEHSRAQTTAQSTSAAKVNWSSEAQMANAADKAARNAPDVRADRVAELKAAIADGSYKVDAKALADKMIESSLKDDLLTRG